MTCLPAMKPDQRLEFLAAESIHSCRRSPKRSAARLLELVEEDPEMIIALVGRDQLRDLVLQYVTGKLEPKTPPE